MKQNNNKTIEERTMEDYLKNEIIRRRNGLNKTLAVYDKAIEIYSKATIALLKSNPSEDDIIALKQVLQYERRKAENEIKELKRELKELKKERQYYKEMIDLKRRFENVLEELPSIINDDTNTTRN